MKTKLLLAMVSIGFLAMFTSTVWADGERKSLVVNSGGGQCPGATFTRIQDAINEAAAHQTIEVCAGLYAETLEINKSLLIVFSPGALVMPLHVPQSTISLATGNPIAAIVTVRNSQDVGIVGLVADAGASGITECAPNLMGVVFENSSGHIKGSTIKNTLLSSNLNGCQSGNGIFVQSGNGGTSDVAISGNRVAGYQKNGITANDPGTYVEISKNTVVGLGPTSGAAQNGIQIGFGATGKITQNFVSGNIWAQCVSLTNCTLFATGILVEQSDDVVVRENSVGDNQVNIFTDGKRTAIASNHLFGSVVLDSIVVSGDDSEVEFNDIINSARAAVAVSGLGTSVVHNKITSAPIGVWVAANSLSSTHIAENDYDNVTADVVDPRGVPGSSDPLK
jgi:Periplasmic copper-binding protein (NosD)